MSLRRFAYLCFKFFLTKQTEKRPDSKLVIENGQDSWTYQDVHGEHDFEVQTIAAAQFEWESQKCASRCFGCVIQAEPETVLPVPTVGGPELATSLPTTDFNDQVAGVTVSPDTNWAEADVGDANTLADLSGFLQRPVRIHTLNWLESDPVGYLGTNTIDPWSLFFSNAAIQRKIDNYAFLRATLKIKIIINSTPFNYGAAKVVYTPLWTTHGRIPTSTNALNLVPQSQLPGAWIFPQNSQGCELSLPFYKHENFIALTSATDMADMGRLSFLVYSALRSANGVTATGVSIQVYAWAEDVVLAGPTVSLALQARDEYGLGPVSAPASTVAKLAGMMKGIPIISKFATATEMGAKAVSGIAQLFGFTNVPVIDPPIGVRNTPLPQFSTSAIGYPVEKLTFDPKNELAIDNSIVGFGSDDQLAIESLVTRPCYISSNTWSVTTPVDTPLFTALVTPNMYVRPNGTQDLAMSPLDLVQRMFKFWRGDIIFTFKIIASPFHKGRLRLSYDPASPSVQTTGDTGPYVMNMIFDLSEGESEIEFRVPYQQAVSWLTTRTNTSYAGRAHAITPTPAFAAASDVNGYLSLKVLTLLTAPEASSSVDILVFVRGADNMEFSNALDVQTDLSMFSIQAEAEAVAVAPGNVATSVATRGRIYMGEEIRSLRHLLRRTHYVDTLAMTGTANGSVTNITMGKYPPYYGYDGGGGIHLARNQAGTANVPFNWSYTLPYHLLASCFLGQRGSAMWTFTSTDPSVNLRVMRNNSAAVSTATLIPATATALPNADTNPTARARYLAMQKAGSGGSSVVAMDTQNGITVSIPNMVNYKFGPTNAFANTAWGTGASLEFDSITVQATTSKDNASTKILRYFSVGTDFNFQYFMYVPIWQVYAAVPAAPV